MQIQSYKLGIYTRLLYFRIVFDHSIRLSSSIATNQYLTMPTIDIILANVQAGKLALPYFQRGYVWGRPQVRDLFDSLYRKHPVGSLLTWHTQRDGAPIELLLDGQQRLTSLYGVIKGGPPEFFGGEEKAFKGLNFHAIDEKFEFYQPIKMKGDLFWFDVTEVMQAGPDGIDDLIANQFEVFDESLDTKTQLRIWKNLTKLIALRQKEFYIDQIADPQKKADEVIDIFNRLNSAGTRLSTGDLALAKISAQWPDVRSEMREIVEDWKTQDFNFTLDWLLRCVNAVVYGEAAFRHLHTTPRTIFEKGLNKTVGHVDTTLNQISNKLGLDHNRVLFAKYAIPIIVRHLELRKGRFLEQTEWNLLLYWYLRAGMHGRFSGSTEAKIKQSLEKLDGTLGGVERLIAEIGTTWGRSQIIPADFDSWSIGAYSYPILYWMTRVGGAMNFCDGVQLKTGLLGKGSKLQVHHIFPKAVLYKAKYMRPQVNAIGNFCFLTAACNQWISATAPVEPSTRNKGIEDPDLRRIRSEGYFPWVQEKYPGVLESQWIPMDEELWKVENYPDFLDARRQLLASAANKYLADLNPGHIESENVPPIQPDVSPSAKFESHISSADEEDALKKLQDWMASHGAPIGEFGYGLMEESEGSGGVIIDLAWPRGLPEDQGRPVALLLNESAETYRTVNQAGYDCYTDVELFKRHVKDKITGE